MSAPHLAHLLLERGGEIFDRLRFEARESSGGGEDLTDTINFLPLLDIRLQCMMCLLERARASCASFHHGRCGESSGR